MATKKNKNENWTRDYIFNIAMVLLTNPKLLLSIGASFLTKKLPLYVIIDPRSHRTIRILATESHNTMPLNARTVRLIIPFVSK